MLFLDVLLYLRNIIFYCILSSNIAFYDFIFNMKDAILFHRTQYYFTTPIYDFISHYKIIVRNVGSYCAILFYSTQIISHDPIETHIAQYEIIRRNVIL